MSVCLSGWLAGCLSVCLSVCSSGGRPGRNPRAIHFVHFNLAINGALDLKLPYGFGSGDFCSARSLGRSFVEAPGRSAAV